MKQTNASPKHSSWVYYLGTLAMLASMLLLPHLIPSWADGITPAGVSIACVFVGAIIGILTTNDLILCALFAMGGLVINGIQTPAQVISSFMGASYVWQIVVLYALCYVIIRDNTGEVIARFLLTRRFTQKYPMVMVMMLLFAFGLAAAFMGVFGALIVGFTLLDGIYAEAGIEPKSKLARLLCLGAFITMCIGPMTIGSMEALNLAAGQFFLAAAGVQVVTFRFVAEAFAILIAFCAVFALALRFLFRCDIRALGRVDLAQALADKPLRLTRRQWIPLAAFLIIALHSFTSPYWPAGAERPKGNGHRSFYLSGPGGAGPYPGGRGTDLLPCGGLHQGSELAHCHGRCLHGSYRRPAGGRRVRHQSLADAGPGWPLLQPQPPALCGHDGTYYLGAHQLLL